MRTLDWSDIFNGWLLALLIPLPTLWSVDGTLILLAFPLALGIYAMGVAEHRYYRMAQERRRARRAQGG